MSDPTPTPPPQRPTEPPVETLLDAAHGQNQPPKDSAPVSAQHPHWPAIPGYEILGEISHGGQGVVYRALQKSTHREVAIKVLLEGPFATESAQKRFEREVELVSHLKHPNIIAVFDSGRAPDGRLYYVMDYVRGVPLTAYIRESKPTLAQALALFASICDAVNHAHQKGVIHRDLKPSNILVDTDGTLHILDFGLARALAEPAEKLVTLTGQIVGTLPYMSPEQARGSSDLLDVRTDVYALGVILYEMLTGAYPYPVVGEMADVLKHIAHTEPTSLTRSWTRESGIGPSARLRARIKCPIDNEVETIALKALAKERERRYQGAGELAGDVRHYLANEPIEAKRDSGLYILRKTLRRYRVPVAVAAAFVVMLGVFAVAMAISRNRAVKAEAEAHQQRDRAVAAESDTRSVLDFFISRVLAAARPEGQAGGLGHGVTIRAAVDAAEPAITSSFGDRPLVEASIRYALGMTYGYLGQYKAQLRQQERCFALRKAVLGPDHPDTLDAMSELAGACDFDHQHSRAVDLYEETLKRRRITLGPDHPHTIGTLHNLAVVYCGVGRYREAVPILEEGVRLEKARFGPNHPETLTAMHNLAAIYDCYVNSRKAVPIYEEVLARRRVVLGADHPDTVHTMLALALAYQEVDRLPEAVTLLEEVVRLQKIKLGPDHPRTVDSIGRLAEAYTRSGQFGKAAEMYRQSFWSSRRRDPDATTRPSTRPAP